MKWINAGIESYTKEIIKDFENKLAQFDNYNPSEEYRSKLRKRLLESINVILMKG